MRLKSLFGCHCFVRKRRNKECFIEKHCARERKKCVWKMSLIIKRQCKWNIAAKKKLYGYCLWLRCFGVFFDVFYRWFGCLFACTTFWWLCCVFRVPFLRRIKYAYQLFVVWCAFTTGKCVRNVCVCLSPVENSLRDPIILPLMSFNCLNIVRFHRRHFIDFCVCVCACACLHSEIWFIVLHEACVFYGQILSTPTLVANNLSNKK